MPLFNLTIERTEIWTHEIEVEADSLDAAISETNARLGEEGWDPVCDDDDGEYEECYSSVRAGVAVEE